MMKFLIDEFNDKIQNVDFDIYGVIDSGNNIHTLGTDSKIIGRVFEMFTQPILEEIAAKHGLILKTPDSQTVYPDFIMMENESSTDKIAIDVKTTYINSNKSKCKFTLGSYASYMRNNSKNIEYQYTDYSKHYVIGFIYKRNDLAQESRVYSFEESGDIIPPYQDVRCFIQEKYKIAGDKPGSGNTENIGSISSSNINDFVLGKGPFAELGADIYDLYWKYYPKYTDKTKSYTSLEEFVDWIQYQENLELLYEFDYESVIERIKKYKNKYGK